MIEMRPPAVMAEAGVSGGVAAGALAPLDVGGEGGTAADYLALLKPRVMSLVVFTGLTGMVLAPGHLHPVLAAVAVLCIAVGAGAAGAINMWYDRDIDEMMARTARRPLPQGAVAAGEALAFGLLLAVGSVTVMGLAVNGPAAALLAFTIAFYVLVYTMWLKRRTPQNIVIGGAAGAFPPMIGWTAVTGDVGLPSLVLFAIIFMWTPPHFWALSLYRADDYARAGVPMLPVVAGLAETRRQILVYSLILVPLTLVPVAMGMLAWLYGVGAAALGAVFLHYAVRVWRRKDERSAKQLFGYSILYLLLVFALMLADRLVWAGGA